MRILIADTYYPQFLKSLPFNPAATYESELKAVMAESFGTADFYSRNLQALGWETRDVIVNHKPLQELWASENPGWSGGDRFEAQMYVFSPRVVFMQDLSLRPPFRKESRPKGMEHPLLAGQCSCPMPPEENLRHYDVIFTSFPHYVDRFERMGIKAVFNPLAFDPIVLDRVGPVGDRIHDVVFVGGVGNPSHWAHGLETLEAVAREIPTFKWWGYGAETLPSHSPLRAKYQGQAWGREMYEIFLQSKIVINRHGEVAQGYANNMRMFEATGCGALLMTERAPNLHDYFSGVEAVAYGSPEEAVYSIRRLLDNDMARNAVARNGQARTLKDHTYAQRMKAISDTLQGMLAQCQSVHRGTAKRRIGRSGTRPDEQRNQRRIPRTDD